ncbi:hypothetical protein AVEN_256952-1 [Araneus ventricosus]|uniref:Reverse transcriptase/retrotransposon-derived protein RNase H-like domain-containing protein n=1 Tax=Araneus ventricosus TaxID=182803 RepID=A0A4Y2EGM1_ARAVE|nr:hypothetical protein AVEN_256952-1 [Araneus ventricosus]
MVKAGVIQKLTEPTDWVSPLVIVQKKNGALGIRLDPQNLNRTIKRPHYNLPTFKDITSKLAEAKYFSVLDAVSAFWQISLDEDSSRFCTFSSPFGRFKFLRLPYGIKELIKNNTVWLWDPSYDKILDSIKEQLTKSPVLAFFDPRFESEIVVDASPFGLGAVLHQRGKPIAFASSTLTPAHPNYADIEKELLYLVFGCKKFHQYVYGTKFNRLSAAKR